MKSTSWLGIFLLGIFATTTQHRGYAQETLQDPIPQLPSSSAPPPPAWAYPLVESLLTCEQAHFVSKKTVERLGYTVTTFTPATVPAKMESSKPRVWDSGERKNQ